MKAMPPVIVLATAAYAIFAAVSFFVPILLLIEIIWALILSISIAVVVAYARPAFHALFNRERPDLVAQLTLGIALGWVAHIVQSGWHLLWRMADQPKWMLNTHFNVFILFSFLLAGVLHLTAPGAIDGRIPRRNMVVLGLALGGSVLVTTMVLIFEPSAPALTEWLQPYMELPQPSRG